jgi:hypothetical protein
VSLTAFHARRALGVSCAHLRRWRRAGLLPGSGSRGKPAVWTAGDAVTLALLQKWDSAPEPFRSAPLSTLAPVIAQLHRGQIAEAAESALVYLREGMAPRAPTAWAVLDLKAAALYPADRVFTLTPLVSAAADRVAALLGG